MADTSRQGRYHNRRYRQLADELGLDVSETPPIGWSGTSVPDTTREEYRDELEQLAAALVMWRLAEAPGGSGKKSCNLLVQLRVRPAHPRRAQDPQRYVNRVRRVRGAVRARR